jgi:hypothetical protein
MPVEAFDFGGTALAMRALAVLRAEHVLNRQQAALQPLASSVHWVAGRATRVLLSAGGLRAQVEAYAATQSGEVDEINAGGVRGRAGAASPGKKARVGKRAGASRSARGRQAAAGAIGPEGGVGVANVTRPNVAGVSGDSADGVLGGDEDVSERAFEQWLFSPSVLEEFAALFTQAPSASAGLALSRDGSRVDGGRAGAPEGHGETPGESAGVTSRRADGPAVIELPGSIAGPTRGAAAAARTSSRRATKAAMVSNEHSGECRLDPDASRQAAAARVNVFKEVSDEPDSQAASYSVPDPRLASSSRLLADDAGTGRRNRRQQGHGLRARRGVDQEGGVDSRGEQGSLFVDLPGDRRAG